MCKGPQLREALQKWQNIQSKHYKTIWKQKWCTDSTWGVTSKQVTRVSSELSQLVNLTRSNRGCFWENYLIFVIFVVMCVVVIGESFSERPAMCQLVSGWHVQDTQGSWYRQWDGYITNQHPEKAARWAFWIICGPKRQQAANQSDQRLTEGNVCTPFCCYTTFWLRNNMIFDLIHNKIIMISSRWYQGFCMCNCSQRPPDRWKCTSPLSW